MRLRESYHWFPDITLISDLGRWEIRYTYAYAFALASFSSRFISVLCDDLGQVKVYSNREASSLSTHWLIRVMKLSPYSAWALGSRAGTTAQ